jgi:pimeloyl-ACP methyl ester carboxylesterase
LIPRRQVSLDGVTTAFLDAGRGEPMVALHGVPTSSALFEPLLAHLSGHRLIAPDLLGQGDTKAPERGPIGYMEYKRHLDAFLATVPPKKFDLLAHDLGGMLGLEWAAEHPELVRSLIVLSTTVTWSFRVGVLIYAANLLFGRSFVRTVVPSTLKRHRTLAPSLLETWSAPWTRARILRGLDLFAPSHLRRLRSKLGRIQVPVLVIWGDEDNVFPPRSVEAVMRHLPQATLVTIPRCGHWSLLDAPDEVARHIVTFLNARTTTGP